MKATVVDWFVCRREGHRPAVTITKVSGIRITSYVTTCLRCGKHIEIEVEA